MSNHVTDCDVYDKIYDVKYDLKLKGYSVFAVTQVGDIVTQSALSVQHTIRVSLVPCGGTLTMIL